MNIQSKAPPSRMTKSIHPTNNNNNVQKNIHSDQQQQQQQQRQVLVVVVRLLYSWRSGVLLVLLLVTAWSAVQIWGEERYHLSVLPGTQQQRQPPLWLHQNVSRETNDTVTANTMLVVPFSSSSSSSSSSVGILEAAAAETTILSDAAAASSSSGSVMATPSTTTTTTTTTTIRVEAASSHVSFATAAAARQFVESRQNAHVAQDRFPTWKLRGLGYLYSMHQILLAAELRHSAPLASRPGESSSWSSSHVVRIENVYPDVDSSNPRTDCHLLTIWVRVNGPELFAGNAPAIQPENATQSCYWEFDFDLQVPGTYHVDAKVLLWNGNATTTMNATTMNQCEVRNGRPNNATTLLAFPRHGGFQGFKLYTPASSCCEICSRQPACRYWATPPFDLPDPSFLINGCELFYDANVEEEAIPQSIRIPDLIRYGVPLLRSRRTTTRRLSVDDNDLFQHGPPHSNPTAYFLGCGWSYHFTLDFPCLSGDLDDRVYLSQSNFTFSLMSTTTTTKSSDSSSSSAAASSNLPLCHLATRPSNQRGRWVRKAWPDQAVCPSPMEPDVNITRIPAQKFDGAFPHCWHRDDLYTAKQYCFEQNCRFIPPESIWFSSLQEERNWFGIWKYYDCDLVEFTDTELQACIQKRSITPFDVRGTSIAKNLRQYTDQRSRNLTFFDTAQTGARKVIIDTVSSPHLVWKQDHQEWMGTLHAMKPVANDTDYYIINPFYWSSEREPHVHAGSAAKLAQWMETILRPKGYKVIDALELTKAFTYDTATQMDGVHIIGPPMKMIVTIILHDLCAGVVNGTRL